MNQTERGEAGRSRRALLRAVGAGVGVCCAAGVGHAVGAATAESESTPTVMTQNLYLGIDFTRLLAARSYDGFRRIVGEFLDGIDPRVYRARAVAVAASVAAASPDVIALQEASLFRKQEPGDFGSDGAEAASTVVVDLLKSFEAALEDRGLDYRRAAVTTASDAELPALTDDGSADFRVTDRDALLVREGVDVDGVVTDTFDTDIALPIPDTDHTVSLRRGYCLADLTVGDADFTAVSTHLESVSSFLRVLQAEELLAALPEGVPTVLCGDLNSGPGYESDAYDLLTDSFSDPYPRLRPKSTGDTCCQSPDLRNEQSRLERRIDAVLCRDGVRATEIGRINHRQADRRTVTRGNDTVSVWPSDHAGLVATLEHD